MKKPLAAIGTHSPALPTTLGQALHRCVQQHLATPLGKTAAVLLGSLFVALCAQLAVPLPWTPVPMTMQPFGVLLVGLLLGPSLGAAALAAYLLEGAAGLPVFVPGFGGLLPLGPSAGYLLAYPLVAATAGALWHISRSKPNRTGLTAFLHALAACTVADVILLSSGAAWLAVLTHSSFATAAHLGIYPFIGGEAVKALLAAAIATGCLRAFHPVHTPPAN
jgi:biotin transport system substrate-specific component